ncbi:MAG: hypothetical protein IKE89_02465 [Bacilli bacterium]|nr:hypothetical protein [Bacilli bacterium]
MNVNYYDIDNKKYTIANDFTIDNINYLLLVNLEDEDDVLLRKVDPSDDNYLIPLDNEDEVYKVLETIEE